MNTPDPEILRTSAIAFLREIDSQSEADLLLACKFEIKSAQKYLHTNVLGLNITVRCRANALERFQDTNSFLETPTDEMRNIKKAIESVLPVEFKVNEIVARSFLVDRSEFEKTEVERLIETQKDLMIAVATGGPRIQSKNSEYKERRRLIAEKLREIGKQDPNPFEDLWAWYGRWSSGDLPSYQSRREYIRDLYQPLLESIVIEEDGSVTEPSREPTGWNKVDRVVDSIIAGLGSAKAEEDYQTVGLLCRECLISLAQEVFDSNKHKTSDSIEPSKTDAYRMLDAYFSYDFSGSTNEALRKHAKASLSLANELQHKRTATYKHAALCSEATRTVVNIVAITSGRR